MNLIKRKECKDKHARVCVFTGGFIPQNFLINSPWSVAFLTGFWVDDTLRCTLLGGEGALLLGRSVPGRDFNDKMTPSSSCKTEFSMIHEHKAVVSSYFDASVGTKARMWSCMRVPLNSYSQAADRLPWFHCIFVWRESPRYPLEGNPSEALCLSGQHRHNVILILFFNTISFCNFLYRYILHLTISPVLLGSL